MRNKYRQGDVIITPINSVKGKGKEEMVLAYGEVTGHKHLVVCEKEEAQLYEENGILYLHVEANEISLYHGTDEQISRQKSGAKFDYEKEDCHSPITLPKGNYEIKIQREYMPEGWRHVTD